MSSSQILTYLTYAFYAIILALLLANGLANQLKISLEYAASWLAQNPAFGTLQKVWSFDRSQEREAELRPEKVDAYYERKHRKDPAFTKADAEKYVRQPQSATAEEIFTAWVRRFMYLVFGAVVISADLILVATRLGPIIFGGNIPDILVPLVKYLTAIASSLFVTLGLLSGILIQEYSGNLPFVVQLHPEFGPLPRLVYRLLAIAVMIITLGSSIVLAYSAAVLSNNGTGIGTLTLAGILMGITIGVILAAFLAFEGILRAFIGLASVIVLVPLGILAGVLSLILRLGAIFLGFFASVNGVLTSFVARIFATAQGKPLIQTFPQDISLIGYGDQGSDFVQEMSKQTQILYEGSGKPILYNVNVYSGSGDDKTRDTLSAMGIFAAGIFPLNAAIQNPIDQLCKGYAGAFGTNMNIEKTLLWVADGLDMQKCLIELKNLQNSGIQKLKIMLIWLVPATVTPALKSVAREIEAWFHEADSILMTTLVVMDDSPLMSETAGIANTLVGRSLSGFIGAPFGNGQGAKFADTITRFHDSGNPFIGISSSNVGVPAKKQRNTVIVNPQIASTTLQGIAVEQIDKQRLNSTKDTWHARQITTFVNFIVPSQAIETKVNTLVTQWLRDKYFITPNTVTFVEANTIDQGITPNVPRIFAAYVGSVYLQTTILYGLASIPQTLQ